MKTYISMMHSDCWMFPSVCKPMVSIQGSTSLSAINKRWIKSVLIFCLFSLLAVNSGYSTKVDTDYLYISIEGKVYRNGETASISCAANFFRVGMGKRLTNGTDVTFYSSELTWNVSSNYQSAYYDYTRTEITLDPNREDGRITGQTIYGDQITIYIQQKPTPSFTIAPLLCSPGQSGYYAVTLNFYGPGTGNVIWETTGGVKVNNSNYYRVDWNTLSSATIQLNSYGTVTVYGELPGCGNIRSHYTTIHLGAPSGSDISFVGNPDPGSTLMAGQSYNFGSTLSLPSYYTYSWSIPQGNSNVGYFYGYGPNVTVSPSSGSTPGGFIVQMDVTNTNCNTVGSTSRTFFKSGSGGYYRIANNPTTDDIIVNFEPTEEIGSLPTSLVLSHEKAGKVKEISVPKNENKDEAKRGLILKMNVRDLPRGIYYLQGLFNGGKTQRDRIVIQ